MKQLKKKTKKFVVIYIYVYRKAKEQRLFFSLNLKVVPFIWLSNQGTLHGSFYRRFKKGYYHDII